MSWPLPMKLVLSRLPLQLPCSLCFLTQSRLQVRVLHLGHLYLAAISLHMEQRSFIVAVVVVVGSAAAIFLLLLLSGRRGSLLLLLVGGCRRRGRLESAQGRF